MLVSPRRRLRIAEYVAKIVDTAKQFTAREGKLPQRVYLTPHAFDEVCEYLGGELGRSAQDVSASLRSGGPFVYGMRVVVTQHPVVAAFNDYCTYEVADDYMGHFIMRCGIRAKNPGDLSYINVRMLPLFNAPSTMDRLHEAANNVLRSLDDAGRYLISSAPTFRNIDIIVNAHNVYSPKSRDSVMHDLQNTDWGRAYLASEGLSRMMVRG